MATNTNFAPVHVTISPARAGDEQEEKKTSVAGSGTEMQNMQRMMWAMQQELEELRQSSRRTIADTLQPVHGEKPGEYHASAAITRPPVVGLQHRATDVRRQSMGFPSNLYAATPRPSATYTPAPRLPRVRQMDSLDEDAEEQHGGTQAAAESAAAAAAAAAAAGQRAAASEPSHDGMPVYDQALERVRKSINTSMKPFHGQTDMDKYNVLDWCEKLDTSFSVHMGTRESGRLGIVRGLLGGAALKWMNRKLVELTEMAERGELGEDIEWKTMRKPFIDAHLGINTIETFKTQLRALRLGSLQTPTPVELNQQFDHLAGLAYPDRRSEMRDTVLGDEYSRIVAASSTTIFRNVMYNQNPTAIEEWKLAVSRRWAAGQLATAVEAQVRGSANVGNGGGRGGWQGKNSKSNTATATVAAALAEAEGLATSDRGEGEPFTGEGEEDLHGMTDTRSGQGGGRGGRGGRGRGGAGGRGSRQHSLSAEQQKQYAEGRCFNCNEQGHVSAKCPKPRHQQQQQQQQGKVSADK
jgi:hypothetical protein